MVVAATGLLLVPGLAATGTRAEVLGIGFVINGAALAVYNVLAVTIRQEVPPPELLGAVTASYRIAAFGSLPLGALVGGVLSDAVGPTAALWAVTLSLFASALFLLTSPVRRAGTVAEVRTLGNPESEENHDGR
jgi:hypothetical protein